MGTTKDDFQSFGSLPLAIDMLNNLVMTGAMLWEVDFNMLKSTSNSNMQYAILAAICNPCSNMQYAILADMPSGPFDLETSSDPNINNTSSSVQSRCDGHSEGSVSGRSSGVSSGSDRLKCCEKHYPSRVTFSEFELAVVPFLCRLGTDEVSRFRHFKAFQNSLELDLRL